jgi:hypothetical protein
MRLLDVQTKKLHTFYGDQIPPYAILSHMWFKDHEEVSFQQIQSPWKCKSILGFQKIEFLCQQAKKDGYHWAWCDTCCIDKSSSTELSESINSMFSWYRNSKTCYAYLADTDKARNDNYLRSRWWTRSWTLQELLASRKMVIYDRNWQVIGQKATLTAAISGLTGIDEETLQEPDHMMFRSIAQRMSWASNRKATRSEDVAYSLLGIFGIHMTLRYGEGNYAFVRLQRKIMKRTNDQSLFAWGFSHLTIHDIVDSAFEVPKEDEEVEDSANDSQTIFMDPTLSEELESSLYGMFADHPRRFRNCGELVFHHRHAPYAHSAELNGALQLEISMAYHPAALSLPKGGYGYRIGLLPCSLKSHPHDLVGFFLRRWTTGQRFQRVSPGSDVFTFVIHSREAAIEETGKVWIDHILWLLQDKYSELEESSTRVSIVINGSLIRYMGYEFVGALPASWAWDSTRSALLLKTSNVRQDRMVIGFQNKFTSQILCIVLGLTISRYGSPTLKGIKIMHLELTGRDSRTGTQEAIQRTLMMALDESVQLGTDNRSTLESIEAYIAPRRIFNQVIYTLNFTEPARAIESGMPRKMAG